MFGFFQPVPFPWDFPCLPSGTQHIECHLCSSCIDNASACFPQTGGLSCNYHHTTEPSSPARLCTAISPTRALTLRGGFSISSLWTQMSTARKGQQQNRKPGLTVADGCPHGNPQPASLPLLSSDLVYLSLFLRRGGGQGWSTD